jgi:uncharacterized protein YneF (UPF0154 family)
MLEQLKVPALKNWSHETLKVFDICQHIYKHAEEFYQYLGEVHREHGQIARMWGLLAIDKCNHSDAYKMLNRLKGAGIHEINVSVEMATNLLIKMKSIQKDDKKNPPSVLNTLKFVMIMEEKLSTVHIAQVAKLYDKKDEVLLYSALKTSNSIYKMIKDQSIS